MGKKEKKGKGYKQLTGSDFFPVIRPTDTTPMPWHDAVRSDPDKPLRALGIIRQRGRIDGNLAEYDPRAPAPGARPGQDPVRLLMERQLGWWVYTPLAEGMARLPVEPHKGTKGTEPAEQQAFAADGPQACLVDRVGTAGARLTDAGDSQPAAVIRIVGSFTVADFAISPEKRRELEKRNIGDRMRMLPGMDDDLPSRKYDIAEQTKKERARRVRSQRRSMCNVDNLNDTLMLGASPVAARRRTRQSEARSLAASVADDDADTGAIMAAAGLDTMKGVADMPSDPAAVGKQIKAGKLPKGLSSVELEISEQKVRKKLKSAAAYNSSVVQGFKDLIVHSDSDSEEADAKLPQPPNSKDNDPNDRELVKWRRKLKPHHLVRYIRQYLQRSVPAAAQELGAVVVCNDRIERPQIPGSNEPLRQLVPGDIYKSLNKGFFGLREADEKKKKGADNGDDEESGKGAYVVRDRPVSKASLLGIHAIDDHQRDNLRSLVAQSVAHAELSPHRAPPSGLNENQAVRHLEDHVGSNVANVCRKLNNFTHHLFLWQDPVKRVPASRRDILEYTDRLVDTLANGKMHDESLAETVKQIPDRAGAQSCTILVGGDNLTAQLELMRSVSQRWPIIVIEGSGGYADDIAGHIHSVEEKKAAPSMDDFRNFLGKIDPKTATIINSGLIKLVARGTSADQLKTIILQALSPDETLHLAWLKYATWDYNCWCCRKVFIFSQVAVLWVGICTIALSIALTYLQLRFPIATGIAIGQDCCDDSLDSNDGKLVGRIYNILTMVVVILPVLISLLESVQSKLNAGGRWVDLRSVSEVLLREIYLFRTQTERYAHNKIAESQYKRSQGDEADHEDAAKDAAWRVREKELDKQEQIKKDQTRGRDGEKQIEENFAETDDRGAYKTRQEKLNHWIEHLTEKLKDSPASQQQLYHYRGPLPPHHILVTGDTGWKDLTPEEYVHFRLRPLLTRYEYAGKYYEKKARRFFVVNMSLGAVGTMLAAMSTLPWLEKENLNLQAIVALTTGISNAITRYVDYTRLEWVARKGQDVKMRLTCVQSWWDKSCSQPDGQRVRDTLVHQVEELVTGESIEWGGQMKKAMERQKKEKGDAERENQERMDKLKAGEDLEEVKKIKEMGLQNLNADKLAAALANPTGPEGQQIFETMQRLNDHVDETTGLNMKDEVMKTKIAKEAARKVEALKSTAEQFLDEAGNLLDMNLGSLALNDFVPADLDEIIKDPKTRKNMFRDLGKITDITNMSRSDFLKLSNRGGDTMKGKVGELTQRQMLETMKQSAITTLADDLIEGLKSKGGKQGESDMGISLFDLVPRKDMIEELLNELKDLNKVPWREMQRDAITDILKNQDIRDKLKQLHEVQLRRVLKRAYRILVEDETKVASLLVTVYKKISRLDMEELLSTPHLKSEMFDTIDLLSKNKFDVSFLAKEEILQKLPAQLRELPHVKSKVQAQLVEYIKTVQTGFNVTRVFKAYERLTKKNSITKKMPSYYAKVMHDPDKDPVIVSFKKNKSLCDRFVYAVKSVSQLDANKCDKNALMKKLQMSPALTSAMTEEIKFLQKETITHLISGLKSQIANSYQGRVFDVLCDEVASFDLRNLIPDPEDREKFINRIQEFRGIDITQLTKQQIITTIAFQSLVLSCIKLTEDQLRELVGRALALMGAGFHTSMFVRTARLLAEDPRYLSNPLTKANRVVQHKVELANMDEELIDRICMCVARAPRDLADIIPSDHPVEDLRERLPDILAARNDESEESKALRELLLDNLVGESTVHDQFSHWNTTDMWILLAQLRYFIGERVAANIFESQARDFIAVDPGISGRFRVLFFHPERRRLMLDCLTPLCKFRFRDLEKMSDEEIIDKMVFVVGGATTTDSGHSPLQLREFLNCMHDVFESEPQDNGKLGDPVAQNKGRFKRVVLQMYNDMMITVPYRIFLKLAMQIASFDFREVIDDPQTRRLLTVVIYKAYVAQKNEDSLLEWAADGEQPLKEIMVVYGEPEHERTSDKQKTKRKETSVVKKKAKSILDAMDALGTYDMIVNDLRMLTGEQLQLVVQYIIHQFEHTQAGRFFCELMQSFDDGVHGRIQYDSLMEAVSSIRGHMQLTPTKVANDFFGYNAKQFFTVNTEEQRLNIVRRYCPDDNTAHAVSQYQMEELEDLFSHLQSVPYALISDAQLSEAMSQRELPRVFDERHEPFHRRIQELHNVLVQASGLQGAVAVGP